MNYNEYVNILELVPEKSKVSKTEDIKLNNIYIFVKKFLQHKKVKKILLSLSGGVDSMVLCYILKNISSEYDDFHFYCCHINYNNRNESIEEKNFLEKWCNSLDINLIVNNIDHIKRGDSKRSEYEEETRNIRYSFYEKVIKQYNLSGVLLAHHKDDYSENVFNNIMRGSNNITNLAVFKKHNKIMNVDVYRPMLDFIKSEIYDISHKFQIPYFLDTTPDWSCRGKMRRKIFPECEDCYGESFMKNLYNIGAQSEAINLILSKFLINPIIGSIKFGKLGFLIPKTISLKEKVILENVMNKVTNSLNIPGCKKKNLLILIDKFNSTCEVNLIKKYKTFITEDYLVFLKENSINKIYTFKGKGEISLSFQITDDSINTYSELINGNFYYKYDNKLGKCLTNKGKKRNKLKKIHLNDSINKYIPQMYKYEDSDEEITDDRYSKYVKVSLSDFIK